MVEEELEKATENLEIKFKIALIKRHMTHKELSELIGTSQAQVSRALKGDNMPSSKKIRTKAAKILGI